MRPVRSVKHPQSQEIPVAKLRNSEIPTRLISVSQEPGLLIDVLQAAE